MSQSSDPQFDFVSRIKIQLRIIDAIVKLPDFTITKLIELLEITDFSQMCLYCLAGYDRSSFSLITLLQYPALLLRILKRHLKSIRSEKTSYLFCFVGYHCIVWHVGKDITSAKI